MNSTKCDRCGKIIGKDEEYYCYDLCRAHGIGMQQVMDNITQFDFCRVCNFKISKEFVELKGQSK